MRGVLGKASGWAHPCFPQLPHSASLSSSQTPPNDIGFSFIILYLFFCCCCCCRVLFSLPSRSRGREFLPEPESAAAQPGSPLREVDHRHPLVQVPALPAETHQLTQRWVLPLRRLRVLERGRQKAPARQQKQPESGAGGWGEHGRKSRSVNHLKLLARQTNKSGLGACEEFSFGLWGRVGKGGKIGGRDKRGGRERKRGERKREK